MAEVVDKAPVTLVFAGNFINLQGNILTPVTSIKQNVYLCLRSQVDKDGHFCLIGSFSLRCASTSFSRFARRISTISHSPNLLFPSFEVKIFQLTSVSWFCL